MRVDAASESVCSSPANRSQEPTHTVAAADILVGAVDIERDSAGLADVDDRVEAALISRTLSSVVPVVATTATGTMSAAMSSSIAAASASWSETLVPFGSGSERTWSVPIPSGLPLA